MRILFPRIPFDGGKSGISVYIREVSEALKRQGHEVTEINEPEGRRAIFSMLSHLFRLPYGIRWKDYDCCILPAANRRAFCRYPIPTVAVVHDLSQYHVEAKYDALRMFYIKHVLPHFVRKAHRVVAISHSTADDLRKFWRIPESKISVVYDGFTPQIAPQNGTSDARDILYISRIEHPGKNHQNLIRAFNLLPPELANTHRLVLAGSDWSGAEAVHQEAEKSPYRDRIVFTGFVPNERLGELWNSAKCYVFPSRFEGFGLSLLEAMNAGVPCACSKTSALGEIGKDVAELFDPENPQEISNAIQRLLQEDNTQRIAAGKAKAALFSWDKCARELTQSFATPSVFGIPINTVTMSEALDFTLNHKNLGRPAFIAFVNAHCLNVSTMNAEYAEILRGCDQVWPDGKGVKMAGDRLGFPVPENVNGTDLFPLLCKRLSDGSSSQSIFLYGARPGVAEKAAQNCLKEYPGLKIAGVCDGYQPEEVVLKKISEAKPDILLVALGVPLQEKWISRHLNVLPCRTILAVGGLLDFVSGRIPRAPLWMRKHGLEWVYRFYQEPVRMFRRYIIGNPLFLHRVNCEKKSREK